MDIPEILQQLRTVPDEAEFAPYEQALKAAAGHREAIIPELIAALETVIDHPQFYLENAEASLHEFALLLLAQFQATEAQAVCLRFFSLPDDQASMLTGDLVTENGSALLASYCGGDPTMLRQLIMNPEVDQFVRGAAIDALLVQHYWGQRPLDAVVEDLRQVLQIPPASRNSDYVFATIAILIADHHLEDLVSEMRKAFTLGLVDGSVIARENFEECLAQDATTQVEFFKSSNVPIDAIDESRVWCCFHSDDDDEFDDDEEDHEFEAEVDSDRIQGNDDEDWAEQFADATAGVVHQDAADDEIPMPYLAPSKPGRNEPCPCGSGKKFKKCCGRF